MSRFAKKSEVRQLKNGRFQYVATGRFAPTKNGRPLAPGVKKDKLGRVYDVEQKSSQARKNFNLPPPPPKPKPKPKKKSGVSRAGLVLIQPPNIYTPEENEPNDKDLEAVAAIAPNLEPGESTMGGHFLATVPRWATEWWLKKRNKQDFQWLWTTRQTVAITPPWLAS